jgi:hypothetical protein
VCVLENQKTELEPGVAGVSAGADLRREKQQQTNPGLSPSNTVHHGLPSTLPPTQIMKRTDSNPGSLRLLRLRTRMPAHLMLGSAGAQPSPRKLIYSISAIEPRSKWHLHEEDDQYGRLTRHFPCSEMDVGFCRNWRHGVGTGKRMTLSDHGGTRRRCTGGFSCVESTYARIIPGEIPPRRSTAL